MEVASVATIATVRHLHFFAIEKARFHAEPSVVLCRPAVGHARLLDCRRAMCAGFRNKCDQLWLSVEGVSILGRETPPTGGVGCDRFPRRVTVRLP